VLELETPESDTQNTKFCAVKCEIRDPQNKQAESQKRKTEMKEVVNHAIMFDDAFEFEIDEERNTELRILLFKQKTSSFIGGKKAVANAAFHVKQILLNCELVGGEIDKYFNLFNREGNAVGGQVRLKLNYFPTKKKPERVGKDGKGAIPDFADKAYSKKEEEAAKKIQTIVRKKTTEKKKTKKSGDGGFYLLGAVVAGAIGFLAYHNQQQSEGKKIAADAKKSGVSSITLCI